VDGALLAVGALLTDGGAVGESEKDGPGVPAVGPGITVSNGMSFGTSLGGLLL